jgi:hypothetical protein
VQSNALQRRTTARPYLFYWWRRRWFLLGQRWNPSSKQVAEPWLGPVAGWTTDRLAATLTTTTADSILGRTPVTARGFLLGKRRHTTAKQIAKPRLRSAIVTTCQGRRFVFGQRCDRSADGRRTRGSAKVCQRQFLSILRKRTQLERHEKLFSDHLSQGFTGIGEGPDGVHSGSFHVLGGRKEAVERRS